MNSNPRYHRDLDDSDKSGYRPVDTSADQHASCVETTVTTLSLYRSLPVRVLIDLNRHHNFTEDQTVDVLNQLTLENRIKLTHVTDTHPRQTSVSLIESDGDTDLLPVVHVSYWQRLKRWLLSQLTRNLGPVALIIVALFFTAGVALTAEPMPAWVLPGIVSRESSSYYMNGGIHYVDRKDGLDEERGPFQLTHGAFMLIATSGDSFDRVRYDVLYAEQLTVRYLNWLHQRTNDWFIAVAKYHTGLHGDYGIGWRYAKDVQRRGSLKKKLATGSQ